MASPKDRVFCETIRSACPIDLKSTVHNGLIWHCDICQVSWKPDQPFPGCEGSPEQLDVPVMRRAMVGVPLSLHLIVAAIVAVAIPLTFLATALLTK